ncbi:hypothetical protein BO78DRAFT_390081 [Aspergillus sclerotiicarbonarius CBS 121057]|uniref:F-box domain-containing protein n=1 Tax=Aspergillus sclerotiicarbonarius (strain CBS 121057 / IBT 28362) TaxID=1448318 RepID=A0A319DZD0_ASPSB|nr:hypothetical protein BO78DRAFT_390081 [Aspergillus sclerotiicarbonarius CBS 121057]
MSTKIFRSLICCRRPNEITTSDPLATDLPLAKMATRRNPKLVDFPTELLYMIAEHLDPCDRTCLALCNSRLRETYGIPEHFGDNKSRPGWKTIVSKKAGRGRFLTRLSRDIPDYISCGNCLLLHRREFIHHPGSPTLSDSGWGCYSSPIVWWPIFDPQIKKRYWLNWLHVAAGMKPYHFGRPYAVPTDWLASVEILSESIDAVGVPGPSLCLRLQTWALGPHEASWRSVPRWALCAHVRPDSSDLADKAFVEDGVHKCIRCAMEYHVRIMNIDELTGLVIPNGSRSDLD